MREYISEWCKENYGNDSVYVDNPDFLPHVIETYLLSTNKSNLKTIAITKMSDILRKDNNSITEGEELIFMGCIDLLRILEHKH